VQEPSSIEAVLSKFKAVGSVQPSGSIFSLRVTNTVIVKGLNP
jgi:hypothetical protein